MFEGFAHHRLGVAGGTAEVDLLTAGEGPPLVLLHGFPQTRATWHLVAPRLAGAFTVIVPDLRGYGRSAGPPPGPEGEGYTKREMAADMAEASGWPTGVRWMRRSGSPGWCCSTS